MAESKQDKPALQERLGYSLFLAIHFASIDIVRMLISSRAKLQRRAKGLFMAAERIELIPELLPEIMAAISAKEEDLTVALGIAVDLQRLAPTEALLAVGANPTADCSELLEPRNTPMRIASAQNNDDFVKLLAQYIK